MTGSGNYEAASQAEVRRLRLPDGRTLGYGLYGPGDGTPVLLHYGTPGTLHMGSDRLIPVLENRIRLLVPDRPGYGESTRYPGRSVAQVVDDVRVLADELGWDRFPVWGGSGGGPHALACAALLADRVTRCASVVGPAPFDAAGLDWLAGMSPGNIEEFTRAQAGEDAFRPLVEQLAREAVAAVKNGELPISDDYQLADSDRAALAEQLKSPGYLLRTQASCTGGIDGWIDDSFAFIRDWGFDVTGITVPVSIWYGPDDSLCPRAHTDWLAQHIPNAEHRALSGGHLLGLESLRQLYRWLIGQPGS